MKRILVLLFLTVFTIHFQAQENQILVRNPSINTDGTHITFSYQGDIWTCATRAEAAKRLTIHEAYETDPQWSPDGNQIAFSSNRHGNSDIYVMDREGREVKRLSYHSATDRWPRWTSDKRIIFSTRRNFVQLERNTEIYSIPVDSGTPQRILNAVGNMATISPNGRFIAFVRGICRNVREAYTGPAQKDIWIFDKEHGKYHKISTSSAQDIAPDFGSDNTLYYLSAKSGRYNIYSQNLSADGQAKGKPVQITKHRDEGIRSFDVSANGAHMVYAHGEGVYLSKNGAKARAMDIKLTGDFRFYSNEKKSLSGNISDYALSPDEKYIAFVARGELFIKKNDKEKKQSKNLTNTAAREVNTAWLNDSTLLYTSDKAGNYDLYLLHSSDPNEQSLYKSFKHNTRRLTHTPEDENNFVLSPDKKQISIVLGRGKLMVADIDEQGVLSNQQILQDGWDIPEDISWSPDSKWLAYALEDLNFNQEIFIHAADNSKGPINVSLHPRTDSDPVWSPDGSKLGFLSIRNNGDADIWFAWLTKEDWEKSKRDWEDEEEDEDKNGKNGKKSGTAKDSSDQVEPILIDFDDIHKRLQQVTRLPGNENNLLLDPEGEKFYFTTNSSGWVTSGGKQELRSIKWDGTDEKTVLSNGEISNLKWDKKAKNLYGLQSGGKLAKIKLEGAKLEKLPHMAKMRIDHPAERNQIYEELWRNLRDGFYDPDFHSQDFVGLKEKYRSRVMGASTTQDFRDMVNEMLGQLNASHMGLYRTPNPEDVQKDNTGYLGIEVLAVPSGVRIERIIPNSPADKVRSKLNIGEIITHVNGQAVSPTVNFWQLLDEARDELILLNVSSSENSNREVIIRPTNSLSNLLYEEWVEERKKMTYEYSNGRIGYIHIRAMGWNSFERFERELMASGYGKEGIVIDVRFNGGGWTTDMVMAVLDVRQHAYTIPRGAAKSLNKEHKDFKSYYPFGERLPLSWWTKPSIALCNESSYSNAEIFSHAYKTLGIGTLVGKPTFGAVISTGGKTLIDGSYIRLPFRGWFVKATEQNMEFEPAVPDIIIEDPVDAKARGEDPQLKTAVEELLRQIGN